MDRRTRLLQCESVTYPGLERVKFVLHYIVPKVRAEDVDLSEPTPERDRDEPDYDAPKPLTAMENFLQNDEHCVR